MSFDNQGYASGWQPIETAPKSGEHILLVSKGGAVWLGHWRDADTPPRWGAGWTRFNCADLGWEPTHWMPLPSPPESTP